MLITRLLTCQTKGCFELTKRGTQVLTPHSLGIHRDWVWLWQSWNQAIPLPAGEGGQGTAVIAGC